MPAPLPQPRRRLIVNADDFGRSPGVNEAVRRAHREGILTSASLMVNEPACAEAVAIAREHPRLGVGLHLTFVCGRAALPPARIPGLADAGGRFPENAVQAGCRYFFSKRLAAQLRDEMAAQFERFRATGLPLDHVNGHLNIHLHPRIFDLLMENADAWGVRNVRLTRDRFWLNARLASGTWLYRLSHAAIFGALAARSAPALRRRSLRFTPTVFGLLQTSRVTADYLLALLPRLPEGDSELYCHPSMQESPHELEALTDPRVRDQIRLLGLPLIRYQDLT